MVWTINTISFTLAGLYFWAKLLLPPPTLFLFCVGWLYGKVTIKSIMPPAPKEVGTRSRGGGGAGFAKGLYPPLPCQSYQTKGTLPPSIRK